MGAVLSMLAGGASAAGGVFMSGVSTASTVFCFGVDGFLAFVALIVECGGYAFTALGFGFTLFSGCFLPCFTELLRPASEWNGSEAKRAGWLLSLVACLIVCTFVLLFSVFVAFWLTAGWYEGQLIANNADLHAQLRSSET